jgi:hypothetical protein
MGSWCSKPDTFTGERFANAESGTDNVWLHDRASGRCKQIAKFLSSRNGLHHDVPGDVLGKLRRSLHSCHLTRVLHARESAPLEIYSDHAVSREFQLKTDDNLFTYWRQFAFGPDIQWAA